MMMNETHSPDRLSELLRTVEPPARFDVDRVRDRIERSARRHAMRRDAMLWTLRAAAASAFFLLGSFYSNRAATDIGLRQLGRIDGINVATPGASPLASLVGATLPMSIQHSGSGYVASLAALTELRDRLTPEEREVARQVAISVLAGAIAELASAGDGRLPPEVLQAVLGQGVPTAVLEWNTPRIR
jgi:hypothetical protein